MLDGASDCFDVSGFGRFIRADENSKNMTDLRAYRCRVAVDDVREIPRRLSIIMGDEIIAVHVHLESSERLRARGDDHPPPPPPEPAVPNKGGRGSIMQGGRRDEGRGDAGDGSDVVDSGVIASDFDRGSAILEFSRSQGQRGRRRGSVPQAR